MRHVVFLFLSALLLVSCSTSTQKIRLCPQVASIRQLDTIEDHGRDPIAPDTLIALAKMERIEGGCDYDDDGVDVHFDLHILGTKGPRLGGDRVSFPYFVSLVAPTGEVISKEIMSVEFDFMDGQHENSKVELMHVFIPLEEKESAEKYRILLGFQLTPEQLEAKK